MDGELLITVITDYNELYCTRYRFRCRRSYEFFMSVELEHLGAYVKLKVIVL